MFINFLIFHPSSFAHYSQLSQFISQSILTTFISIVLQIAPSLNLQKNREKNKIEKRRTKYRKEENSLPVIKKLPINSSTVKSFDKRSEKEKKNRYVISECNLYKLFVCMRVYPHITYV